MNTVPTSDKHNGVPVSIPRGSYGMARLTARLYEYPKGHPCRGCPFTLRTSVPSCMFPSRKDGGCLWYDLKRKKRPPLPLLCLCLCAGLLCGGLAACQSQPAPKAGSASSEASSDTSSQSPERLILEALAPYA